MGAKPISLSLTRIDDSFWNRYISLVPREILPYQRAVLYDELPDVEKSHAIANLRIAAGLEEGDFYGFVFQDSDLAKWLEAVAYSLATTPDPDLEEEADKVIALLAAAQKENGYLDTYFQIREGGAEFVNLRDGHELYCAGHLIEAGVAYKRATGKDSLLNICIRMADHIVEVFHKEPLLRGVPGHEEIELALVKLYEETGNTAYLDMAADFLDRRGQTPYYFEEERRRKGWMQIFPEHPGEGYCYEYSQSHRPVRQQVKATGHAVRATYLYCAMADVAAYRQDDALLAACKALYENITTRQMYVTGSIGSSGFLERFTVDYDLPNTSNYSETCASIGLALFSRRMAAHLLDATYMDTAELALYNTVLSGISQDGKSFFYVNPLSVWPPACMDATSLSHVKPVRQKWFGCACCPPNIARTLASLSEYTYFVSPGELYVNLYVSGEAQVTLGEKDFRLKVDTRFPFAGDVVLRLEERIEDTEESTEEAKGKEGKGKEETEALEEERKTAEERLAAYQKSYEEKENAKTRGEEKKVPGALHLRLPSYVPSYRLSLARQGMEQMLRILPEKGYLTIPGPFQAGDEIHLTMPLLVHQLRANPEVRADAGRVCLAKGPVIYCLEEVDNGSNLEQLLLDPSSPVREVYREDILGGTLCLQARGYRSTLSSFPEGSLYASAEVELSP
ncbi:MAG: glycoside hydrolase family 127 protein, partial [Blautia sp.]|nr:glycoside hydrolase family 127 protein [Blautia sp.]